MQSCCCGAYCNRRGKLMWRRKLDRIRRRCRRGAQVSASRIHSTAISSSTTQSQSLKNEMTSVEREISPELQQHIDWLFSLLATVSLSDLVCALSASMWHSALRQSLNSHAKAARLLGMNRTTLIEMMKRYRTRCQRDARERKRNRESFHEKA